MKRTTLLLRLIALAAAIWMCGCREKIARDDAVEEPEPSSPRRLRLATTTSTENSGLLRVVLSDFKEKLGVEVDVIAVGTGAALKLGQNGDVDVVLVHARDAEDEFVAAGHGINRRDVMYNDFVVVGPGDDPSELRQALSAEDAFLRLASGKARFISRGDNSGTHMREKLLWKAAGVEPSGPWLLSVGQGMGAALTMADELRANTLSDRGTYLAFKGKIDLAVLSEGDEKYQNPYGVIAVNPRRHTNIDHDRAMLLIEYLTGSDGQRVIDDFRIKGERLFHAIRGEGGSTTK
jgi:tungstate transport system substrate-binding protein